MKTTAAFENCSCAVIKPHIVQGGYIGEIIDMILSKGFEIRALGMFSLDKPLAEEFLDVYKVKLLMLNYRELFQNLVL